MANNDDSFLREIEEDMRRERMEALWKEYGTYFIVAAAAVVIAVGGYQYYKTRAASAARTAGAAFEQAAYLASEKKSGDALKAYTELTKTAPAGYAALARLKVAGLAQEAGDKTNALAQYEALASDGSADPLLKSFAKMQAVALKIGDADFTEVQNRLNDLTQESSPWRSSARELLAVAALKAGKIDVARTALEQLLADRAAPADVRERAQIMMAGIVGKDLAANAPAAPAAGMPGMSGMSGSGMSGMSGMAADKAPVSAPAQK